MENLSNVVQGREIPRLNLFAKMGYGLGDLASGLSWGLLGSYFVIFLTDVAGIEVGIVSAILLVTKIWDGVNDPMFGFIAERTKSKHGRFRPWILYGCPFLGIAVILCFTMPFQAAVMKIIWGTTVYLLADVFYTVVNVSYGALSTVMTYDPKERSELNSWRMIGSSVSQLLAGFSMPLILYFSGVGDGKTILPKGYTITAIVFAIIMIPLFAVVFFTSREVVRPTEERKVPLLETIKTVVTNRPLVYIFFMMLLFFLALSGKMSLSVYYYIYILERPDLVGPIMMSFSIACMVTVFVFKGFSEKIGKLKLLIISCAGSAVCSLMIFFIPNPANNIVLYFVLNTLAGVFISIGAPLHYALVPDAIDYMEDKTGVRADGTSYTAISLSTKIAGAVGTSTGLLIMAVFGYVANVKQTPSGIMGINIGVNLFPMICFGLSIIPVLLYPLTSEKNREIRERLIQKSSIKISQQMEGV